MSMNRTGPWTLKATVNNMANYFQVGGLTDGVTYYFKIRAYDEVPNYSDYTTVFSVVTVDTKPPNPPGNLKASPTTSGYIRLTWTPSNSSDVQGYVIYRTGEGGSGNYNEIARVSSATTSYVDNNVSVGRMYFYQVAAYDEVPNYSTSPEPVGMVADYDYDGDGIGDSFDRDDDNDGVEDLRDAFPYNSAEWADYDGDGIGDNADTDDDNDGIPDSSDAWPLLDINDIEATVDTIEQKIDNLNMTLEDVLDRVKDLQNDYSYFNTSAVALFDELFHRLSRLEANLTSRLETVEGNLTSKIDGMNSTILAELQDVMDRIDSMDGSLRALIESMWADYNTTSASDTQSIINAVNTMWAGLNATHSADLATLIGKIEEMWSGINDTHDEDLRTLLEKIEEMWNGINDTHARDLATLLLRIEELQAYLDGRLNLTREELINKTEEMWDSFNQTLSYVLNTIQTRLNELEGNMEDNFTAMREYIALRMDQLTIYLGIVNATLHYHLSEIEDEMEEFREVTLENLTAIMGYLHDLWQNNTEGREEILNAIEASNELMRNLNTQSMNELRMRLTEIMVYLDGFNTSEGRRHAEMLQSLINKLDEVNSSVQSHLDDIDATLVALQKLDRIIGDIENVDKRVVESKKDLKENDSTIKLYNLILIILLLVVIVLEVLIYMKKGGEGETKVIERDVIKEVGGGK
ncbi:MAG: fibronectin type III domain-containing protein, partial [Thermoplasmata archaeon]|nr:fibronectin type III domain-containing protein [Thermoplasmata archaeon]